MPSTGADTTGTEENNTATMIEANADGDGQQYYSNESLEDKNSTTSSAEGSINVERRKDHEFIPTRMKTINASKPAANPQQFTKVPSNPLLISAQKQMLKVEEIKKTKEMVKKLSAEKIVNDEPDWQSELSSWKNRRRKQSEETLMRVAEIKVLEEGETDPNRRKISLNKKLSGLLYNDDDDWSDLGLQKGSSNKAEEHHHSSERPRSKSKSPINTINEEGHSSGQESGREDSRGGDSGPASIERWTSSSSLSKSNADQREPARRKSSEMSSSMKSRLEAFQAGNSVNGGEMRKSSVDAPPEHESQFKEKLKTFQKISSQSDMSEPLLAKGSTKPPPPLSYSKLIEPQHYQSSSSLMREDSSDFSRDLDDALEESYRSVLSEEGEKKQQQSEDDKSVYKQKDFIPSVLTPPSEKPPPPPPQEAVKDDDIDMQEREIIASLEMEEREHKKYMELKALSISESNKPGNPVVPQPSGGSSPSQQGTKGSSPPRNAAEGNAGSRKSSAPAIQPAKKKDSASKSYNQHWLVQEAEQRRIAELQKRNSASSMTPSPASSSHSPPQAHPAQAPLYENSSNFNMNSSQTSPPIYSNEQFGQPRVQNWVGKKVSTSYDKNNEGLYANLGNNMQHQAGPPPSMHTTHYTPRDSSRIPGPQVPPRNPGEAQERMLSVSGKKKCSHCKDELGRGAAMIIESLRLFYHLRCFQCCVCHVQLGNGNSGTDVRVRNNKLHCQNCYSNDEGLKFSKV